VKVRIGVIYTAKELSLEMADDTDRDALQEQIDSVIGGDAATVWLTEASGRTVGVPADKVAYIEMGSPDDDRAIGFGVK